MEVRVQPWRVHLVVGSESLPNPVFPDGNSCREFQTTMVPYSYESVLFNHSNPIVPLVLVVAIALPMPIRVRAVNCSLHVPICLQGAFYHEKKIAKNYSDDLCYVLQCYVVCEKETMLDEYLRSTWVVELDITWT